METKTFRMSVAHRLANWIAWRILMLGSVVYLYRYSPILASFLGIGIICSFGI